MWMDLENTLAYYDTETIVTFKKKGLKFVLGKYYNTF
jgi:hypothetical protein